MNVNLRKKYTKSKSLILWVCGKFSSSKGLHKNILRWVAQALELEKEIIQLFEMKSQDNAAQTTSLAALQLEI